MVRDRFETPAQPAPGPSEVDRLRRDNRALADQVKQLIRVENELNRVREYLDKQVRLYRKLYEVGTRFNATFALADVIELTVHFVLYELTFQRCLVLMCGAGGRTFKVSALDGYYDDEPAYASLTLSASDPVARRLETGSPYLLCALGAQDPELRAFAARAGMDEYVLFPFGGEPKTPHGLLIAGNTAAAAKYHARVEEGETLIGLGNLVSQAATAVNNTVFYRELEQERKLLEAKVEARTHELSEATKAAVEANRAKSAFLANMSHELRTPLNAVIGYAEMLVERFEDSGDTEPISDLEKILVSARHLLALIGDVLDLAKIEAGRMQLVVEEFQVAEIVRDAQTVVQPLMEANRNRFTVVYDPAIGSMRADHVKVRQVLFNLLSNAARFTADGDVELRVERLNTATESFRFIVRDTGIGLTEEQLRHLFTEFSQGDAATVRKYGGTGLGLAISRRFCRLMGGDIEVTSSLGSGSTFIVTLPVRADAPVAAELANQEARQRQ